LSWAALAFPLISVRDHSALAEKMKWFIESYDESERIGKASYRLYREKYDFNRVNRAMLDLMNN
jgi:glycosyltransferase involved in cell wall biosynthesis